MSRLIKPTIVLWFSLLFTSTVFCQTRHGRKEELSAPTPAEVELVRQAAHRLTGDTRDYDPLMELIGDARFVLLGEATHGTHEFYQERARITRRLIEEKGFNLVVLEADWPSAYRVNEYVRGYGKDKSAERAISGFTRFPRWMWRNADFRDFVNWLRSYNESRPSDVRRVGVYGMDLYSLADSAKAVVEYLKRVDPEAAKRARKRYGCFESYRDRPEQYGYDVASRERDSCEKRATEQMREMEQRLAAWASSPGRRADDDLLSAYQNARVVKGAEAYYRLMYHQNFHTWNLRDSHMAGTIQELVRYWHALGGDAAKVVVWAHNTHQGDARMTERGKKGELSVGQLMRQFHDGNSVLVGFTTYTGKVMAASQWGESGRKMKVRPALDESYSALFRETGVPNFLLVFRGNEKLKQALSRPRLERAIGVIYLHGTERKSHYFKSEMSRRFDAVIHLDVTSAVEPVK